MSDEKLSEQVEHDLQVALPCIEKMPFDKDGPERECGGACPAHFRQFVRPLLARLERERSDALNALWNDYQAHVCSCNAPDYMCEFHQKIEAARERFAAAGVDGDIGKFIAASWLDYQRGIVDGAENVTSRFHTLAPSVVSQPSHEREVLEEVASALRGILDIGKRDMTNPKYDGYFEEARRVLAALTATPASTGGEK